MAYTQSDLDAVQTAITKLVAGDRIVSVSVGGRTTQYHPVDLPQLRALRSEMMAEVNAAAGESRQVLIRQMSKGL